MTRTGVELHGRGFEEKDYKSSGDLKNIFILERGSKLFLVPQ